MATVNFRTNVLLKSIIGKDLITDDNIAILELVKNSFDAASNKVEIEFLNIKNNDDENGEVGIVSDFSKIVISDAGIGMSSYDLINKWLNIAYSEKKEKREEYGRVLAGNKGVGRFSCDRLGRFLNIYTRKRNGFFINLFIDWEWFEKIGEIDLNIQDISLEMNEMSEQEFVEKTNLAPFEYGTILEISLLRESWHYNKILSLKRQLERLINPNQTFKASPFEITINAIDYLPEEVDKEEYERINGPVRNRIFENLNFKTTSINSSIDDTGEYITTTLQDRGNNIFELVEKNSFAELKDVSIYIYYLNPYSKAYFTKQTGIRAINFGSIFLFINGFRIPPYGDEGDDWLGMENRKGQGYNRYLGTREVVGRIEIKDERERFRIISSRSGVLNNEPFIQLTKNESPFGYYYKTFRRLERFVVEGIRWDSTLEDERKLEKKVLNDPDWDETKEIYSEDSFTRNKRVLSVIRNIIDAKRTEIIKLAINENFVNELIEEQTRKAQAELDYIAEQLKSKKLTSQEISYFLDKINLSRDELKTFSSILDANDESRQERFTEIKIIDKNLEIKYNELKVEKEKLEIQLTIEEEARKKVEEELEAEKKKNVFTSALIGTDKERIIGLQHQIFHSSSRITRNIKLLLKKIKTEALDENLKKHINVISLEASKINSIANFITKANFNLHASEIRTDIIQFIKLYIEEIYLSQDSPIDSKIKNITIEIQGNIQHIMELRPLEISTLVDNFIQNSEKANATMLTFNFSKNNKQLIIEVVDDGIGITIKNEDKIFDFGFSTTNGSGIGLYQIKEIIERMKGNITVIKFHKNTDFQIVLP